MRCRQCSQARTNRSPGKSGTITLSVDGRTVGSGKVQQTTLFRYSLSENQDIGKDTGTPVVYDYQEPFVFQGQLDEVVVELGNQTTRSAQLRSQRHRDE